MFLGYYSKRDFQNSIAQSSSPLSVSDSAKASCIQRWLGYCFKSNVQNSIAQSLSLFSATASSNRSHKSKSFDPPPKTTSKSQLPNHILFLQPPCKVGLGCWRGLGPASLGTAKTQSPRHSRSPFLANASANSSCMSTQ